MRLGLYGGTFDPIHIAHLIIAEQALEELGLDRLIFMPSKIPPHKNNAHISPADVRLEMVKLALEKQPKFSLSDFEITRHGVSYSVHTLQHLQQEYRVDRDNLFMIIGADNYRDFHQWREPERILLMCTPVVAGRPGDKLPDQNRKDTFIILNTPLIEISSTLIRERCKTGKSIKYLVPHAVEAFIRQHQLYC